MADIETSLAFKELASEVTRLRQEVADLKSQRGAAEKRHYTSLWESFKAVQAIAEETFAEINHGFFKLSVVKARINNIREELDKAEASLRAVGCP